MPRNSTDEKKGDDQPPSPRNKKQSTSKKKSKSSSGSIHSGSNKKKHSNPTTSSPELDDPQKSSSFISATKEPSKLKTEYRLSKDKTAQEDILSGHTPVILNPKSSRFFDVDSEGTKQEIPSEEGQEKLKSSSVSRVVEITLKDDIQASDEDRPETSSSMGFTPSNAHNNDPKVVEKLVLGHTPSIDLEKEVDRLVKVAKKQCEKEKIALGNKYDEEIQQLIGDYESQINEAKLNYDNSIEIMLSVKTEELRDSLHKEMVEPLNARLKDAEVEMKRLEGALQEALLAKTQDQSRLAEMTGKCSVSEEDRQRLSKELEKIKTAKENNEAEIVRNKQEEIERLKKVINEREAEAAKLQLEASQLQGGLKTQLTPHAVMLKEGPKTHDPEDKLASSTRRTSQKYNESEDMRLKDPSLQGVLAKFDEKSNSRSDVEVGNQSYKAHLGEEERKLLELEVENNRLKNQFKRFSVLEEENKRFKEQFDKKAHLEKENARLKEECNRKDTSKLMANTHNTDNFEDLNAVCLTAAVNPTNNLTLSANGPPKGQNISHTQGGSEGLKPRVPNDRSIYEDEASLQNKVQLLETRVEDLRQFIETVDESRRLISTYDEYTESDKYGGITTTVVHSVHEEVSVTVSSSEQNVRTVQAMPGPSAPSHGQHGAVNSNRNPSDPPPTDLTAIVERLGQLEQTLEIFRARYNDQMGQLQSSINSHENQYRNVMGELSNEIESVKGLIIDHDRGQGQPNRHNNRRPKPNSGFDDNYSECDRF